MGWRREDAVRKIPLVRKLNSAAYYYRSNRWRWSPRFRWAPQDQIAIDRPVFLLGTQGGGLTLTARILRRNPRLVSVTGDCTYWAGEDEMQNVLRDVLPPPLTWRDVVAPQLPTRNHNWLYACDALLPYYRETGDTATPSLRAQFEKLIRSILWMNTSGHPEGKRFIDKSQSYTVRIGLIRALLASSRPKFVVLTRNPFAMCWRAVYHVRAMKALDLPLHAKLALAVQHWRNSFAEALKEKDAGDVRFWRFEDVLARPREMLAEICDFIEVDFQQAMLPRPDDRIPWGSMFDAFNRHKWYPLREDVNDRYLRELPTWAAEYIAKEVGDLATKFAYSA